MERLHEMMTFAKNRKSKSFLEQILFKFENWVMTSLLVNFFKTYRKCMSNKKLSMAITDEENKLIA